MTLIHNLCNLCFNVPQIARVPFVHSCIGCRYADSDDGIHFRKRFDLGIPYPWNGTHHVNITGTNILEWGDAASGAMCHLAIIVAMTHHTHTVTHASRVRHGRDIGPSRTECFAAVCVGRLKRRMLMTPIPYPPLTPRPTPSPLSQVQSTGLVLELQALRSTAGQSRAWHQVAAMPLPRCTHAYMHTYIHAYMHTDTHTYRHTYVHTYRHTHVHTYTRAHT